MSTPLYHRRGRRGLPPPPSRDRVEEPVVEAAPVAPEAPSWDPKMLKAELLAMAQGLGLAVTEANTKAEIMAALEAV